MYVPFFLMVFWQNQQIGIIAKMVSRAVAGMDVPSAMASFLLHSSLQF